MKTTKIIAPLAAVFTFLLFEEGAGINYLLFLLIYLPVLFKLNPASFVRKQTLPYIAASAFAAVCVLLYGNILSIFTFWIAFTFLNFNIHTELSSVFTLIFQSIYAFSSTHLIRLKKALWAEPKTDSADDNEKSGGLNRWFIWIISIIILALFMTFYRHASAGFNQFILNLNIDFLSFPMFMFFVFGFLLLYIWVKPAINTYITEREINWKNNSLAYQFVPYSFLGSAITKETENRLAVVVLGGLNLMLLLMNIFDTEFLFTHVLPDGVSYSEYVHQGVGAIILSIVCAVALILWFYRGNRKFNEHSITGMLVMIWIAFNVWMIASAAVRNHLYIMDYHMYTYKRIGVYFFLGLALIGLSLTAYKILYGKNNYFLVRTNTGIWFTVLVLSCALNWDKMIAENHIEQCNAAGVTPDFRYMLTMSPETYPAACKEILKLKPEVKNQITRDGDSTQIIQLPDGINRMLNYRLEMNYYNTRDYTWKSYCVAHRKTNIEIYELMKGASSPYITEENRQYLRELATQSGYQP